MSSADLAVRATPLDVPVHRGTFGRQVRAELRLIFLRRRNIAMLLVLALIPMLIGIALKISGEPRGGGGPAFFALISSSGLFLAFASLALCLPAGVPLAVAVVGGDSI